MTAQEMRELDREAIEVLGIPGIVLMENAGRGAACAAWRTFPDLASRRVAVLCGRGNNGGDGFVMARCLLARGVEVDVYVAGATDQVEGDARMALDILRRLGVSLREVGPRGVGSGQIPLASYGLIVDALLGTGLNAQVRGIPAELIEAINRSRAPVLAMDIPSGLCADSGRPQGAAVEATLTVTFGLPKLGHFLGQGRELCGDLWVVDIGIPPQAIDAKGLSRAVITPAELRGLLPPRPSQAHKGHFGHVLVLAGSPGKTGAGAMASEAALRAGAGLVTLGLPRSLNAAMEARLTEVMTLPLPETPAQTLGLEGVGEIRQALEGKRCVALGPGLSTHPETQALVRELVRWAPLPMVVDADGLNALAGDPELLREAPAPRILTPHPGEMARLLGSSVEQVQGDRVGAALELARRGGAWVVLKGAGTVLADPEGRVGLVPTGNPAMASGGTGDLLTGLVAGFTAQGLGPFQAMALGAYLHGWVADQWAAERGRRGLAATDLLAPIPAALERLVGGDAPRAWPRPAQGCPFHV